MALPNRGGLRRYPRKHKPDRENMGLSVGQCRGESCKFYRARRKTRGEETARTPLVVHARSTRVAATHGRGWSEIQLRILVDISCKSRCRVHSCDSWSAHASTPTPRAKVILTAGSMKLILHVSPPVLVEHTHISRH